jgi:hypothetical protein
MEMTTLQYITSAEHGCCNTKELMELAKADKAAVETLKEYARQEMTNKGIAIK